MVDMEVFVIIAQFITTNATGLFLVPRCLYVCTVYVCTECTTTLNVHFRRSFFVPPGLCAVLLVAHPYSSVIPRASADRSPVTTSAGLLLAIYLSF